MPCTPGIPECGWSQPSHGGGAHESVHWTSRSGFFSSIFGPPSAWSACWVVLLVFAAVEVADEVLACVTGPLRAPSLRIASEIALLVGLRCVDVADEFALCSLPASWPIACTPPP